MVGGKRWVCEVVGVGVGVVEETARFVLDSAGKSFGLQLGACLAGELMGHGDGGGLIQCH